jgi:uncharacterized membrane protein YagU involved in acid resistance
MSDQIFKNKIPNDMLFNLLGQICIKTDQYYLFTNESFKKGVYLNHIQHFIVLCTPYYHLSKRKYLDKKLTYNSFTTILRQICNYNIIKYTSKIKYDQSSYSIIYFVYTFEDLSSQENKQIISV